MIRRQVLIWAAAVAMAFVFSIDDFAWPADQDGCSDLYEIVHHEIDRDGNEFWQIWVTTYMQQNGTDANCERFGRCVYDLIGSAGQMGAVEITNPASEWVPSIWRWIESTRGRVLAGLDDNEDDLFVWHWTEYDD